MSYDLAILGGGPAGVAAGVYASRKRLRAVLITDSFGGQSIVSPDIQNWVGTVSISGEQLAKDLKTHLIKYKEDVVDVVERERVAEISKGKDGFDVKTSSGKNFQAKTVLVATGSHRRKLEIPGANEFENKGVTYCASCDGPLFSGQDTVIIGGGNAAFETAAQLLAYCSSVTLINRSEKFRADLVTIKKLSGNPKFKILTSAVPTEIKGGKFVEAIVYQNAETKEKKEIKTGGVFVEIGLLPNTDYLGNLVEFDEFKRVKVNPKNQRASLEGIWAAGDCTDGLYHQNNIAAGDGVKALEDIYLFIHA